MSPNVKTIAADEIVQAIRSKAFQPSKPLREIRFIDLERNPAIIASRKYNGNFATAVVEADGVTFFTASGIELTRLGKTAYWQSGSWQYALRAWPTGTVMLGEIFIPNAAIEDLGAYQLWYTYHRNGKSDPAPQKAAFRAFDILADGQVPRNTEQYCERYARIPHDLRVEQAPYFTLQEASKAVEDAQTKGIEGFVFWDAHAPSLCKISGKNKPRGAAWKVKPLFKERFALLGLVNPEPAALVTLLGNPAVDFNCGSGLTQAERRELIERHRQGKSQSILVGHYGYDEQGKPEMPVMLEFESV